MNFIFLCFRQFTEKGAINRRVIFCADFLLCGIGARRNDIKKHRRFGDAACYVIERQFCVLPD